MGRARKKCGYGLHTIIDFFEAVDIEVSISQIQLIIKAAVSFKTIKKADRMSISFLKDNFNYLICIAFEIEKNKRVWTKTIVEWITRKTFPDVTTIEQLAATPSPWRVFPRHLSANQYLDPRLAITTFVNYTSEKKWYRIKDDLVAYACEKKSINEIEPPYDILMIRLLMLQLIEACHLMYVRTLAETSIKN